MSYRVNSHVERLTKFLPFRAAISEIVTELQQEQQKLDIRTRAIAHVQDLVLKKPRLVVLTGNAGHGKTYICARLLQRHVEGGPEKARELLRSPELRDVGVSLETGDTPTHLRIHTDLSQESIEGGARYLLEAWERRRDATTVVCVNEGRLRAILAKASDTNPASADQLRMALNACVDEGISSASGDLHIINLNYQSVVAKGGMTDAPSMVAHTMRSWLEDARSWQTCRDCKARDQGCPIFRNRELLTEDGGSSTSGSTGARRRRGIEHLFLMAGLMGNVTTIRDMLMLMAYVITGGLSCKEVHEKTAKPRSGWRCAHSFHQTIFAPTLTRDQLKRQPLLARFRSLDPADRARRSVDDRFVVGFEVRPDQADLTLPARRNHSPESALKVAEGMLVNSTGSETGQEEADRLVEAVTVLRRRDFFDLWDTSADPKGELGDRAQRVGFEALSDMVWLRDGEGSSSKQHLNRIKRNLIAGLHAIQGLDPSHGDGAQLSITHPAFSRNHRATAVIQGAVPASKISLHRDPRAWDNAAKSAGAVLVSETTDWSGRELYLHVSGQELRLTLERFEYLRRAGRGFLSRRFFARDIRRILNFLGSVEKQLHGDSSSLTIKTDAGVVALTISDDLVQ